MSSIVKLGPGKSGGPLGVSLKDSEFIRYSTDLRSVLLHAGDCVRVGGVEDGKIAEEGELSANSRYLIYPVVQMNPSRYNLILGYNQELLKYGTVSAPPMLGAGNRNVFISLQVSKKFNITDLDYVFELMMID